MAIKRRGFRGRPQRTKDFTRLNERIRVREVRLIDSEGEQLGVLPTPDALSKAKDMGLDLVEVSPNARPPVCRIMDYGKFKYEKSKKEHEAKKKQTVIHVKEVKLRPKTDTHDLEFKLNHAKRFLEHGDKVKVTCRFRGREMAYKDKGRAVMEQIISELAELAQVEQSPRMEGYTMAMLLVPIKKK